MSPLASVTDGMTELVGPAWDAWRAGDFALARDRATDLAGAGPTADEARHVLALVASVLGDYGDAIAVYHEIDPHYPSLATLDKPITWAYVHRRDAQGALAFAERRGLSDATSDWLRLAVEHPLAVECEGLVEAPFSDDALTPLMPGFAVRLNGRPACARLDTGGGFIHLASDAAAAFGVETHVSKREFAALSWHTLRFGVADLELGPVRLRDAPVVVHEGALPTRQIAGAFGVELGPIVGTNVLERFLTTIDAPGRRLLFSRRGDAEARAAHLARLNDAQATAGFALWGDSRMIARGSVGGVADANLFVDSGLVAANADQGQAALLAPARALEAWDVARPAEGRFAEIPGTLGIGAASRSGATALVVPDAVWSDFGDWGGIRVDALISWGFLGRFSWTIDFDRHTYLFSEAACSA
jgi:hypothetical protein